MKNIKNIKYKKNKFIFLALLFFVVFLPLNIMDLNLHIFGGELLINKSIITITFLCLLLSFFIFIAFFYFLFSKEYRVRYKNDFCETPPDNLLPTTAVLLCKIRNINIIDILSLIAYFYNKNCVYIKEAYKSYAICRNNDFNLEINLENHEKYLLEWLFAHADDGENLSLKKLYNDLAIEENKDNFISRLSKWKEIIIRDTKKYNLFFDYTSVKLIGKIIGITYIIIGITLAYIFDKNVFFIFFFLGIVFYNYCNGLFKRTKNGQEKFERLMAYKRYLKAKISENNDTNNIEFNIIHLPYIIAFFPMLELSNIKILDNDYIINFSDELLYILKTTTK